MLHSNLLVSWTKSWLLCQFWPSLALRLGNMTLECFLHDISFFACGWCFYFKLFVAWSNSKRLYTVLSTVTRHRITSNYLVRSDGLFAMHSLKLRELRSTTYNPFPLSHFHCYPLNNHLGTTHAKETQCRANQSL